MPGNVFSPVAALLCEFDARAWSGTNVMDRGATNISLPSFGTSEGIYDDVLAFLNGGGSYTGADLQSELTAAATAAGAAGTYTITLTSADRIKITNDTENFAIKAGAGNTTYGFDAAGEGAAATITAGSDWIRGRVEDKVIEINPTTGSDFEIPSQDFWAQSVIHLMRENGAVSDADDAHDPSGTFASLQGVDNNASGNADIRWGIDSTGKVWTAWDGSNSYTKLSWPDTTFRDALGFSGNETVQTSGSVKYQVADHPCPYAYVPTRCPQEIVSGVITEGSAIRLTDGGFASSLVGTYERTRVRFYVDGPADSRSTYRNWIRFLKRCVPGRRVTLYQQWTEPRRAMRDHEVVLNQDEYDLLYTTERDGRRGRIRGRWSPENDTEHWMSWPRGRMRRIEVEAVIEHAED